MFLIIDLVLFRNPLELLLLEYNNNKCNNIHYYDM